MQHGPPDQVEDQTGAEGEKGYEESAGEKNIRPEESQAGEDDFSESAGSDHRRKSSAGDDFHEAGPDPREDHGECLGNADMPELLPGGHSDSGGTFQHEIRDTGKSHDGVQENRRNREDRERSNGWTDTGSHDRNEEKKKRKGRHDAEDLEGGGDDLLLFYRLRSQISEGNADCSCDGKGQKTHEEMLPDLEQNLRSVLLYV